MSKSEAEGRASPTATIQEATTGRSATEVLTWSRSLIDPVLRSAVETLPASMCRIAGFHFGWCDEHGRPAAGAGGKAIRPALVLVTAEGAGGAGEGAAAAGVAVELVHNFSLLHDDLMDGDLTRRHRPTAWSVFGSGGAILAGDALLTLAMDVLATSGHPHPTKAIAMLCDTVMRLINGQSIDLLFEERLDVDLSECLTMSGAKTGALLGCACALGASFGGGSQEQVEQVRLFGEQLGLAFQLVDDLLGIWGDPAVTGKPVYSDLNSRKKTLPVVVALTSGTAAGRELAALYRRNQMLSADEQVHAAELIDHAGGRVWSLTQVEDHLAKALRHLWSAGLTEEATVELGALARLATHRDH